VWDELRTKLPWHKNEDERLLRVKYFKAIDLNKNGMLSLAEIEKGLVDVIQLPILFDLKQVIMKAYQQA